MKYLISILLAVTAIYASELGWSNDYKKALVDAKVQNKLVYVFITSDTCRWCKKFENTTLKNKQVLKRLKKSFISIHLSRDRHDIPVEFESAPIPRHYFVDASGVILYSSLGHRDEDTFNAFMDNAQERYEANKIKEQI